MCPLTLQPPENVQLVGMGEPDVGYWGAIALQPYPSAAVGPLLLITDASADHVATRARSRAETSAVRNALLGIPIGAGAVVLSTPDSSSSRARALTVLGREVEQLDGRFVLQLGPDIGDIDLSPLVSTTTHVVDLRPANARQASAQRAAQTTLSALRGALHSVRGCPDLKGLSVCVLGLNADGVELARLMLTDGADVTVSDTSLHAGLAASRELGVETISPEAAVRLPCDVLVPCVDGLLLDAALTGQMKASVVCGPGLDQIATRNDWHRIWAAGIVHVPEEIAGSGVAMAAALALGAMTDVAARDAIDRIQQTARAVVDLASSDHVPPQVAARQILASRSDQAA